MSRPRRAPTVVCVDEYLGDVPADRANSRERHRHGDRGQLRRLRRLHRDGSRRVEHDDSLWASTEREMRAGKLADADAVDIAEADEEE